MQAGSGFIIQGTRSPLAFYQARIRVRERLRKDIVHQASNQLAVVGVVRDPHVVLSGVHAELQVGLTQAPAWGTVVLEGGRKIKQKIIILMFYLKEPKGTVQR